jgi:hypothetical protein
LTKAITILALTCFLLVGAAVTSILARGGVPDAGADMTVAVVQGPVVANRESKQDKLTVPQVALASAEPQQAADISEPLRQAFAYVSSAEVEAAKAAASLPEVAPARAAVNAPPKPKAASKPQPQKSYALLSDAQISGIKERLKLSSSQESYWPAVESALRTVAHKLNAARQVNPNVTAATAIDPDSEEVQQLKSAAMPLLFQLREDQKDEVRKLARVIGLDKVASAI